MYNKKPIKGKIQVLILLLITLGCKKEIQLSFSEKELTSTDQAEISIIYPEAEGTKDIILKINNELEKTMVKSIAFNKENIQGMVLHDAIKNFNDAYVSFKNNFPENQQKWIANIESEVIYQSNEIITIALNSYIDTGGAHGNDIILLLNFNANSGQRLTNESILECNEALKTLAKTYLIKEFSQETAMENYALEEPFYLPENIGFSEEGLIFLYNRYEGPLGFTEFVIPYDEIDTFLKVQ
ncbi:DUF4163 domain-containing protein [Ichthyenterobacterium sp. W332]|uniref:DUF4163 domain-containing protein n=1 Tax=Microcosmobacter mediterraneus TaxID=3075607 RepID=A0ABU2YIB5_9FLAO|nr:DUF4163 domain-containing protein [Ichthyenterobacterium sp. W332]MDT0557914.1 DUF4163 domain-containing protein [Ichthyenterobacterium sp. W332]